ncbi:hypothetical protein [Sphaerisporangium krabiense]|uniref:Uncharacterized protein n=1 Tax=Sphaerisporangium krabiense TaxID=763782 RepID=A0A7W8ZB59_9ACTN|nr:hypothetical protein [Sphaerisporangium krabiense]MBB5630783.1 hypothetical protein [Sphaerisporangium krabiense]
MRTCAGRRRTPGGGGHVHVVKGRVGELPLTRPALSEAGPAAGPLTSTETGTASAQ